VKELHPCNHFPSASSLVKKTINPMKKLRNFTQLLFALFLLPALAFAQTKVAATEILDKINKGEAVAYKGVHIEGDLDMTQLNNKQLKEPDREDNSSKIYTSTVTAPVSFVNCTFKGKVLGYYNTDNDKESGWIGKSLTNTNEMYNTNFNKDVRFENCVFEEVAAFKYSQFGGNVSFAGGRFQQPAIFKYSQFVQGPNFHKAVFADEAVFKYVKFPKGVNFSETAFRQEADFKYAEFSEGVDFQKAAFGGYTDFKYTRFTNPLNMLGASFQGSEDFKYASLDGKKVTFSTLLKKVK
jgi:uncharacterized protein YjbI with pentapeptide repeats